MIRRAKKTDIPRIEELLKQILQVHHQARPDLFQASGQKFDQSDLEKMISDDQKPIFVYTDDKGRVLAHLFTIIQEHKGVNDVPRKTLFIDDLCVDEDYRGQHIGQLLYDFALDYARSLGCYNVTLDAWNDNSGAYRFYERLGLKPQMTRMEQVLPKQSNEKHMSK